MINTSDYSVSTVSGVGIYVPGVAVSPDGPKVYAANGDGNAVSIISTSSNTVTGSIDLGRHVTGLTVSQDGTRVYATSGSSQTVSVINTATNSWPRSMARSSSSMPCRC